MESNVLWGIGASLLIQAVAYGRLIQKVDNIGNKLIGKDGNGGIAAEVQELKTDVEVIKATHIPVSIPKAHVNGGL